MPLNGYGVLKTTPIAALEAADSAHLEIHTLNAETHYRIALNVKSRSIPRELSYIIFENYKHPIIQGLESLPYGFTPLKSKPGGMALDFIRGNLFNYHDMKTAHHISDSYNELMETIERFINSAVKIGNTSLYSFGQKWGPQNETDRYFGFKPSNGIHDIHMNQGNSGNWADDNGVWQDGGLFIHFPYENRWVAIFLAFQSQTFHTDDKTGNPIPAADHPKEHTVIITSALLNPTSGSRTLRLLNTTSDEIDLSGWSVSDKFKNKYKLNGIIKAGEFKTLALQENRLVFPSSGGIISLLNDKGMKINGTYYTAEDYVINQISSCNY